MEIFHSLSYIKAQLDFEISGKRLGVVLDEALKCPSIDKFSERMELPIMHTSTNVSGEIKSTKKKS
jgi:hypothetical protein